MSKFYILEEELGYSYGIVDDNNPAPEGANIVGSQKALDNQIAKAEEKVIKDLEKLSKV